MHTLSTNEVELLTFFEVEPTKTDQDVAWVYNESVYQIARDGLSLSFAIHPSSGDVRMILKRDGQSLYELNAMGILDLRYFNERGSESLKLDLTERETLWIRVKPKIEFQHQLREAT